MKRYALLIVLLFCLLPAAKFANSTQLAYYPLRSNANDSTGQLAPMNLYNTLFIDSSLYCKGIYAGDSISYAYTPLLPTSIFQKFSISARFKVDQLPLSPFWNESPVIMGGFGWRWMGAMIHADSTVAIRYNNSSTCTSSIHYSLGVWHEFLMTYDASKALGCLYLDSVLACSVNFVMDHGNDASFCTADYSRGTWYRGYLKDIRLYNSVLEPIVATQKTKEAATCSTPLLCSYPTPFNPSTAIHFQLPSEASVRLAVYDLNGREIALLVNEKKNAGSHNVRWDASSMTSGTYLCKLQTGTQDVRIQTCKLLLLK